MDLLVKRKIILWDFKCPHDQTSFEIRVTISDFVFNNQVDRGLKYVSLKTPRSVTGWKECAVILAGNNVNHLQAGVHKNLSDKLFLAVPKGSCSTAHAECNVFFIIH